MRADAWRRFAEAELPTEAEEVWRFTEISRLDLDAYAPLLTPPAERALPDPLVPIREAAGEHAAMIMVRNGWVVDTWIDGAVAADGVKVGGLDVLGDDGAEWLAGTDRSPDAFGDLADAFLTDVAVVHVPDGVVVPRPILVLHWIDGDGAAIFPRVIVRAGEASEVTILDHYAGTDARVFVDPTVNINAGDAATVRYLTVQDLGPRAWQIGYQASRAGRDATLTSAAFALGGHYARLRIDNRLPGEGGSANLLALYFGDEDQTHDFRTMQDHEGANTTSDLLFKGVVVDRAHSVYTGMIRVQKGAVGTSASQTNRNLVLTEGARADSVPNLEILENNLRQCTHGSATGPIDEEQRFYLEARGIPTPIADRLIVLGFFDDVLERMPVPGMRPLLRLAVGRKLEGVL